MIKYAQILLISSDRELSDALIDQLELVDSFKIQRTSNLNGLKEFSNGDLIIYDDTGKGSEFLQAFSVNLPTQKVKLADHSILFHPK